MPILPILNAINTFFWLVVVLWLFGSFCRNIVGKAGIGDQFWSLIWCAAFVLLADRLQVAGGIIPEPSVDTSAYNVVTARRLLGTGLIAAIIWTRYKYEGWRW